MWYLEEREKNRNWKIDHNEIEYNYKCLPGIHTYIQNLDMGVHFNPGIFYKLIKEKPDVVMTSGYDSLGYWAALMYCKLFNKKFSVWWGSTLNSSRIQNSIMKKLKSYFFSKADSFVTYGTESTESLEFYGVNRSKIVTGYNTVDIKYFRDAYLDKRSKERSESSIDSLHFLFIGQLIERKGLKNIIDALAKVKHRNWVLKIVGSGPDESKLKNRVKELSLEHHILFEGYKQKEELIDYLVAADCLVFPSLIEVWGLVVNEALVTNNFVLASKYAGATKDIIVNKVNGLIIDPLDEDNLVDSFNWTLENKELVLSDNKLNLNLWRKLHPYSYAKAVSNSIYKAINSGVTNDQSVIYSTIR